MKLALLAGLLLAPVPQDVPASPPSRLIGEHSEPISQLALSPDGGMLVTAAKGEVHAWDVKRDQLLWKADVGLMPTVALGVGDELIVHHVGIAAVEFLNCEDGTRHSGIGGTTAMLESKCLAIDPKDKWVWIGTNRGLVTRVVPNAVNSWSNRAMENGGVTCVVMDGKGKTLAVGGEDGNRAVRRSEER